MQAIHELGHVLGAVITGGSISKVVLHPLEISRTDLANNPHPLVVVWLGPIVGVLVPLLVWFVVWKWKFPGEYIYRSVAGFCLVANGGYIASDAFFRVGDGGDMIRHGSSVWQLLAFGLLTFPCGIALWHGLGPKFGFGESHEKVDRQTTLVLLVLLVVLSGIEFLIDSR